VQQSMHTAVQLESAKRLRSVHIFCLVLFWALALLLLRSPLYAVFNLAAQDQRYSHLLVMPVVSAGMMFLERRRIFANVRPEPKTGIILCILGVGLSFALSLPADNLNWRLLPGSVLALLIIWIGSLLCLFGRRTLTAAVAPVCLLLLAIPIPPTIVEIVETGLQRASAEMTYLLFLATATPVVRADLLFFLPGFVIEVAKECSGIRSFIALLITSVLLSHYFLRTGWKKIAFVLLVVPVAILKNAVRIASLSWLGIYASMDFLTGPLHHRGGSLFSLFALAMLLPILILFHRSEESAHSKSIPAGGGAREADRKTEAPEVCR
jgi:exosortase